MYSGHTRSGKFVPNHWEKYIGKADEIIFRSSWEMRALEFFDNNPNVIHWSYEDIIVPYLKPMPSGDLKLSNYIPDAYVEYKNRKGELKKEMWEIKPAKQTKKSRARKTQTKMYEDYTFAVNQAKWMAADNYCKRFGWDFRIITETSIFGT